MAESNKQESFEISMVRISGNSVFSDSELLNLAQKELGESIDSLKELELIRQRIEEHYIKNGYVGSGSLIPPQELNDGTIDILVVESVLDSIEIKGSNGLKENFIKSQLPAEGKPLNVNEVIQALNRLESNVLVASIRGEIVSKGFGKNALLIDLKENPPAGTSLNFSDSFSPSIGGFGGTAQFTHNNLFGLQDRLRIARSQAEGLGSTAINYSLLLNKDLGRFTFGFNEANSAVVDDEIEDFEITGDFRSFSFDFQQPILKSSKDELIFGITFENIDSETFILEDFSFAFVEGLENGVVL